MVEVGPGHRHYAVRMDGSRNVSLRNRKFLRTFNGVSDMMADEIVPRQQLGEGDGPVRQPVRQEGADGGQDQAVQDVGDVRDVVGGGDRGMEETIGVWRMSRTMLLLLNKLRRRTEQWLGKELGIQGERGGYQQDIRILKWGKEKVKSNSTKGGCMEKERIILSNVI